MALLLLLLLLLTKKKVKATFEIACTQFDLSQLFLVGNALLLESKVIHDLTIFFPQKKKKKKSHQSLLFYIILSNLDLVLSILNSLLSSFLELRP